MIGTGFWMYLIMAILYLNVVTFTCTYYVIFIDSKKYLLTILKKVYISTFV